MSEDCELVQDGERRPGGWMEGEITDVLRQRGKEGVDLGEGTESQSV